MNYIKNITSSAQYSYDYDNRIFSTTEGTEYTEYLYDASGARIGRIAGGSPATVATNYFVIDYTDGLKRPLAETDSSGTITRFYVWSGSQLLCHIEAIAGVPDLGSVRYYHSDELGSTLALTDDSGTVTDEFAYMPYGYANHTPHAGSSDTPFQWLGGYGVYYDSDTDLHLTLHRAYSSKMKRFIHSDPLGIDGGVNVYMWANMNPLAFVDPYGLCAEMINGLFELTDYPKWYAAHILAGMIALDVGGVIPETGRTTNGFKEYLIDNGQGGDVYRHIYMQAAGVMSEGLYGLIAAHQHNDNLQEALAGRAQSTTELRDDLAGQVVGSILNEVYSGNLSKASAKKRLMGLLHE